MKKATHHFLIFALLLAAGLAGCGETGQAQTDPPATPPPAQGQTNEVSPESTAPEIVPPEEFVRISGSTLQMGSPEAEPWRVADETSHTVSLSDFYISRFEVTQKSTKK